MEIKYSPESLEDLQNVKESITETFDDIKLAEQTLRKIMSTIKGLEVFPYKGISIRKTLGILTDYRCIFCKKNYIFYRVEQEQILVVRILNEKQDFVEILFKETERPEE